MGNPSSASSYSPAEPRSLALSLRGLASSLFWISQSNNRSERTKEKDCTISKHSSSRREPDCGRLPNLANTTQTKDLKLENSPKKFCVMAASMVTQRHQWSQTGEHMKTSISLVTWLGEEEEGEKNLEPSFPQILEEPVFQSTGVGWNTSGFPSGAVVKNPPNSAGDQDQGLIPGSGRSPAERNGNSFQYSCLGNPMERGAWQSYNPGSQKSRTWLSTRACTHTHTQAGIHTQSILWSRRKLTKGRAARQARVGRRCSDIRSSASDWLWENVCLLEKRTGQGRAEGQEMEETAETLESNSFKGSQGWPQATGDQIYQQHKTLPSAAPEGQAGTI